DLLTDSIQFDAVVKTTPYGSLEVIPSHIRLVGAEIELVSFPERELVLKNALKPARDRYDFILMDCPPSLGLLTLNGLAAANGVLVPLQAEYFALEGLTQLLQTIRLVQKRINPALRLEGIFLTMFDPRLNLARQVREELLRYFPEHTFNTIINRNVRLAEAPSYGKPIMHFAVSSPGARDYLALAEELLERHKRLAPNDIPDSEAELQPLETGNRELIKGIVSYEQ
ncbi:MAG: ParA family protein, partial [Calditrichota bacterium]